MNFSDQLSLIEANNNAQSLNDKKKASPEANLTDKKDYSESAQSFGNQSYAELKGRASISKIAKPKTCNVAATSEKCAPVLSGYAALSTENEKYLSVKEVAHRYSVSVPTIWRWAKEDEAFPKQHVIRPGTSRWRVKDLLAFENRNLEA